MGNDFSQQEYPFVGRADALQVFDEVIRDLTRKQRVVFYQGAGGIGKTKLLQEIIRRYHDRADLLVAPKILDMAVTRTHRISGVREEIIALLGEEHFTEYRKKQDRFLAERDKPEAERVAESALRGLREAADEQFKKDCEKVSSGRTIVLLFDTFEQVQREDVGHYILFDLARHLPNFVFVIASRQPYPVEELVRTMELKGLAPEDAKAFFASRRQPISDEMAATLWKKLDGHPLRLDMALLWLSIGTLGVEELVKLSTEEKPCSPFDRTLLERLKMLGRMPGVIPETVAGEERDRQEATAFQIILLMAYFNRRFNRQFLEQTYAPVPGLASLDDAINVLNRLPACFFIKQRPDGDLQLHDAMQDLILNCMKDMLTALTGGPSWTDAEKTLAQRAIEVYDALIEETDKEVSQTVDREKREDLERKAQELRAERLGYTLRIDLDKGYKYFIEHFDRNLEKREFGLCELFTAEILPYIVSIEAPLSFPTERWEKKPAEPPVARVSKVTPQIFLCYTRPDRSKVEDLYEKLSSAGFKPWMDKRDILPGEQWEVSIQKAIRNSDFFLACLSVNSVDRRGYLQKEIKDALTIWQEKLSEDIYLIPVRLEECIVPDELRRFQYADLFEKDGWTKLVKAIQEGMVRRGK